MSLDHADLKRLQITAETRAWLTAEATRTGRTAQEIARDELHAIALAKIEAARILIALSGDNGHSVDRRGRPRG